MKIFLLIWYRFENWIFFLKFKYFNENTLAYSCTVSHPGHLVILDLTQVKFQFFFTEIDIHWLYLFLLNLCHLFFLIFFIFYILYDCYGLTFRIVYILLFLTWSLFWINIIYNICVHDVGRNPQNYCLLNKHAMCHMSFFDLYD